jgi:RHH-type transcriptional regulator, rel operon repressor / antitoxin RelB
MGETMKTLTLRVEDDLDARLDNLAHETGRSKSYYARLALQQFLEDREDYLLGIAALERREPAMSLDELERELGLAS